MYAQADYYNRVTRQYASISLQAQPARQSYVVRVKEAGRVSEMERVYSLQEAHQLAAGYQAQILAQPGMARIA